MTVALLAKGMDPLGWDRRPIVAGKDVPGAVEIGSRQRSDAISYLGFNVALRPLG